MLWKNRKEFSKFIIKDKVNLDNIELILKEFEKYAGEDNLNSESGKEIYDILKALADGVFSTGVKQK